MRIPNSLVAAVAVAAVATAITGCSSSAQSEAGPATSQHSPGGAQDRTGDNPPDSSPSGATSSSARAKPTKGAHDDTSGSQAGPPKNQTAVLARLPGAASERCVEVGSRPDVRSGQVAMGNFALARTNFKAAKSAYDSDPSFFYVVPFSRATRSVTVVATRLGTPAAPVTVHSEQVEHAAQWRYFPIQVQIPTSGTWRFRVTSGTDHGCFDASFTT
jgi:hypothetical protein